MAAASTCLATVRHAGWTVDAVEDEGDEYRFFALVLVD
jgi:hypothetical protein